VIEIKSNIERIELYSDNYPFNLSLRIQTFDSETEYIRFVKNCEKLIRGCLEYKFWRDYIIDVLQVQSCAITYERMNECGIDIHHHPVNLFTIVKTVINKKLEKEESFCTFDICTEIIELHFKNWIGFVVLISSLHEKYHSGFLNIPVSLIRGNYTQYLQEYSKFLDEDELKTMNEKLSIREHNCNWSVNNYPGIKKTNEYVNVDVEIL